MKVLTSVPYTHKTARTQCSTCNNELEYDYTDVIFLDTGRWYWNSYYIVCPVCDYQITVDRETVDNLKW